MLNMEQLPIHVAVVEDNGFLIEAILDKLEYSEQIKVSWVARHGAACATALEKDHNLQVVLMDIEMPKVDGIEATRSLKLKFPQIKVIMLTVFDDDDKIFRAIQAGADGYLLKEITAPALFEGICDVLAGGAAMTPSIALKTLRLLRDPSSIPDTPVDDVKLSSREIDVLEQLAQGLTYQAAADNLYISPHTVRKHVENLYGKLRVHNKLHAIAEAKKRNLI